MFNNIFQAKFSLKAILLLSSIILFSCEDKDEDKEAVVPINGTFKLSPESYDCEGLEAVEYLTIDSIFVIIYDDMDDECYSNAYTDWYADTDGDDLCDYNAPTDSQLCNDFIGEGLEDGCEQDLEIDCATNDTDDCGVCNGGNADDLGCGCFEAGPSGCDNTCGSTLANDECGVCDGDNASCSDFCGVPYGDNTSCVDECGIPNGDNSFCADCAGTPNGDAVEDNCGTCDADSSNDCDEDCNGVFGGDAVEDNCGTCDNDPLNDCVQDCDGRWGGGTVNDDCGICGCLLYRSAAAAE